MSSVVWPRNAISASSTVPLVGRENVAGSAPNVPPSSDQPDHALPSHVA